MRLYYQSLLNLIFPTDCRACRQPLDPGARSLICSGCWGSFYYLEGPRCPDCGKSFISSTALAHSPEHLCQDCRLHPPAFEQALSIAAFEGALRQAIHLFKFDGKTLLGRELAELLAQRAGTLLDGQAPDYIIPVPLHWFRRWRRGFNQSKILARALSKTAGAPLAHNLKRIRYTKPQFSVDAKEKEKNVRGAFAVRRPQALKDKTVLLVDDIYTTGATVRECAKVLKKAGARKVLVLTLARAGV
jgi:ComF family protein